MPPFPLLFRANGRKIICRENSLRLLCVGFRGASAATTNPIESQFCHCECKQCDTGGNANAEFVTCNVQKACPFKWIFAIFDQRSTLSIMSEFQTCMRECAHPYKIVRIHWLYMEILCSLAKHICSSRTEESGKWFIFCAFAHYLWRLFPLECLIGVPLMSLSCYFNQMPREMEEFHINRRHIWEMNGKCFAYGFISIFIFIESYHSDVFVFSSAKLIHDELERKSQHTTH